MVDKKEIDNKCKEIQISKEYMRVLKQCQKK